MHGPADVTERPSHGMPAWFVGEGRNQKQFCVFSNDHHGDGRVAPVCAAPEGMQAMLVDSNPDVYYVPPYVGVAGWVGVRLDKRLPWSQVVAIVEVAHANRRQPAKAPPAKRSSMKSSLSANRLPYPHVESRVTAPARHPRQ